jgi:hypothetical protein
VFAIRSHWLAIAVCALGILCVLAWWLSLRPSNNRNWKPDVARTAWADTDGNTITLHNVRDCDYRTETDYTPHWDTRRYELSQLNGLDLFLTYWGSPWIAHTMLSFSFADNQHVAISIETRQEVGESYSAIRGFFRQYELIYVVADERDLVRLRTNFRKGEEVYLYRIKTTPQRARAIFLDYLASINRLHSHPEWYNALTSNCTTNIRTHAVATSEGKSVPMDWRILLNGHLTELLYERDALAGGLPLADLNRQAHINDAARAAGDSPDFSRLIRLNRAGFQN